MKKKETVEEFLARGGQITKIPAVKPEYKLQPVKSTSFDGPAVFLSLEDAGMFYGKSETKKPKKEKPSSKIDLNALPEALRSKIIAKISDGGFDVE